MQTWIWLIIVVVALIGGFVGGFFMARRYMMKYFKENPPIDERKWWLQWVKNHLRRRFNKSWPKWRFVNNQENQSPPNGGLFLI